MKATLLKKGFSIIVTIASIICVIDPAEYVIAQVREGTLYKIQSDSINFGGQEGGGSSGYKVDDTLGEIATGMSSSSSYTMSAGYRQNDDVETYISVSSPANLNLGSISGLIGGASEDTVDWTVTTNNPTGYTMTIAADTSPALASSGIDSFADYVPVGSDPDYDFTVAAPDSVFGFSPEGTDVDIRYKDNGSACNTGSSETSGKCWEGFSMTPITIAGDSVPNAPTGSDITVRMRAESGSSHIQTAGVYSSIITVTVSAL